MSADRRSAEAVDEQLRRVREARLQWLELDDPPRRALQWDLPDWETRHRMGSGGVDYLRECVALVRGWRGLTVGDLIPGAADAGDPLHFSPAMAAHLMADRPEWLAALGKHVVDTLAARAQALENIQGN